MEKDPFILAVITSPRPFPGEEDCLEGLLEAGVQKLHLRRPGMAEAEMEPLLDRLSSRWPERLVLHGGFQMAARYGVPQVHGSFKLQAASCKSDFQMPEDNGSIAISTSVHSWDEMAGLPEGLAYAFISPLFDSISKPGYLANTRLLQGPVTGFPCRALGLGGIDARTIRELVRWGWEGAVVLGWIWERPAEAVSRYRLLVAALWEEKEKLFEKNMYEAGDNR